MLEIKNLNKSYKTGDFIQKALDNISCKFYKGEIVSILGKSGSGKSSFLNVIGTLDKFDSGDIILNNRSIAKFREKELDSYRNNCIGFIFQSYNLINHITVFDNVMLSLLLSDSKKEDRVKRVEEVLAKVGILEHKNKRPTELSGGQMQRVAIARAIVNNPDIILADEITGALDSKTSVEIMNLIKEISEDKLVIMVTHDRNLAEEYSSRIIELSDGKIIKDSKSKKEEIDKNEFVIGKTKMSFLSALQLSFNNIKTKKTRVVLTSLASSIGIIGIALILSLSNGFNKQLSKYEKDTLSTLPIQINNTKMDISNIMKEENKEKLYPKEEEIYPLETYETKFKNNKISNDYLEYIKKQDKDLITGMGIYRQTSINVIAKNNNYQFSNIMNYSMSIPTDNNNLYLKSFYDVLKGRLPEKEDEIVLVITNKNQIEKEVLDLFGIDKDKISFDKILNKELKIIYNNDLYNKINNRYIMNNNLDKLYNNSNSNKTIKVVGILRGMKDKDGFSNSSYIGYREELVDNIIRVNEKSSIVLDQKNSSINLLTGSELTSDKSLVLSSLGYSEKVDGIYIYPKDFKSKEKILKYLDEYNINKSDDKKVYYTDMAKIITSFASNIVSGITIVLVGLSTISLVVSSIMIGIITYISVLERTKEIGILRSLGARRKDIKRVFRAEVFLIGLFSGTLGILITILLNIPINIVISKLTNFTNVATLSIYHGITLILISILLTLLGGNIPASIASKKRIIDCIRD